MKNKIKLTAEYLHPSEDFSEHPKLRRFKKTNRFGRTFETGTYCLFGEKGSQTVLLSISENDGVFHHTIQKQHLLNTIEDADILSLTQYSALISILTRNESTFERLRNSKAGEYDIVDELTSQTFGWLLWSWQIKGLISYYMPSVDANTFIYHLQKESSEAWKHLKEIKTNDGNTVFQLIKQHSLGLKYNIPSYYFGEQLQRLMCR